MPAMPSNATRVGPLEQLNALRSGTICSQRCSMKCRSLLSLLLAASALVAGSVDAGVSAAPRGSALVRLELRGGNVGLNNEAPLRNYS